MLISFFGLACGFINRPIEDILLQNLIFDLMSRHDDAYLLGEIHPTTPAFTSLPCSPPVDPWQPMGLSYSLVSLATVCKVFFVSDHTSL